VVRLIHLQYVVTLTGKETGDSSAIGAGALKAERLDLSQSQRPPFRSS